ncbi:hypothetical protein [uncultured Clostridium sp.]|uniref:hypothetical protein n=1 Tax=uncultured Clostridium sp. TaxID=59620 RepID=UPI0026EBD748|nr:hypothetical protein [uncultured Clostridium sp.]
MERDTKLDNAIRQCDEFIKSGATIQLIRNDREYGGITFSSYDTSSIEYIVDTIKRDRSLIDKLKKSDADKEQSSMNYYNEYRNTLNDLYDRDKIIEEMAYYISQFRDCPLENEGVDLDCESRCGNVDVECWKRYFYKKVGVDYE